MVVSSGGTSCEVTSVWSSVLAGVTSVTGVVAWERDQRGDQWSSVATSRVGVAASSVCSVEASSGWTSCVVSSVWSSGLTGVTSVTGVVAWEQAANGDWVAVHAGSADDSIVRTGLSSQTTYCYRTSLVTAPNTFSSSTCVSVPEPAPPDGYLEFSGDPESFLSAPDFVSGSSLDVRALVAPADWTPDAWQMFAGQFDQLSNDRSWRFGIDSFNSFRANFSADGLEPLGDAMELPDFFVDGVPEWIRLTIDAEAGVERFWISDDGNSWNQWGQDLLFDPLDLHDSAGPVFIGTDRLASDNAFTGRIYYLEIRRGVDGEVSSLLDLRTDGQRTGDNTWTDAVGQVWTGQGSGWSYVEAGDLPSP